MRRGVRMASNRLKFSPRPVDNAKTGARAHASMRLRTRPPLPVRPKRANQEGTVKHEISGGWGVRPAVGTVASSSADLVRHRVYVPSVSEMLTYDSR